MKKYLLIVAVCGLGFHASAQQTKIGGKGKAGGKVKTSDSSVASMTVTAVPKGPNQINLTWTAASNPGYGYVPEIQSDTDSRYSSFTAMPAIPAATGYTCDPAVFWPRTNTDGCNLSDPTGIFIYNPVVNGVPTWVTEAQYSDPQDGTAAQFIAAGLKNNTVYHFRVRTFTGNTSPTYGSYSNVATATTANYAIRYISTTGNDSNDGLTIGTAWASLNKANGVSCGTLVLVSGGNYSDHFGMGQSCTSGNKVVLQAAYGEAPFFAVNTGGGGGAGLTITGTHIVIDGLGYSENYNNDNVINVNGDYSAFFNMNVGPTIIPTTYGGLAINGSHTLLYGNYIHDFGSPYVGQNSGGAGGFLITVDSGSTDTVTWSNHLTRGAHDCSLYRYSTNNRHLNNIVDGGWGMAYETIYGTTGSLFEGTINPSVGALEPFIYKPSFELSYQSSTVRRGVFTLASAAVEVNAYDSAINNLVYNNVFYQPHRCIFQSSDGGADAYIGSTYQNNICDYQDNGMDVYNNTPTVHGFSHNVFWHIGGAITDATLAWNWNGFGGARFSVIYTDANFAPPFDNNATLSTGAPSYVDPTNMDFHLAAGSANLLGAGIAVTDPNWPFAPATPNLGIYQ